MYSLMISNGQHDCPVMSLPACSTLEGSQSAQTTYDLNKCWHSQGKAVQAGAFVDNLKNPHGLKILELCLNCLKYSRVSNLK